MLSADVNCNDFKLVNIVTTSGSSSSLLPVAVETSGAISPALEYLTPVNTLLTSGVITPASPSTNSRFAIVDSRANASVNNILINFSGATQKLYGSLQNYIINEDGGYITFRYLNSTIGWVAEK